MNTFVKTLKSEIIKTKGSFGLLSSLGVALFINILHFLIFYFKHEYFAKMSTNPWMIFTSFELSTLSFLFPFYLMLIAYLITNIEHSSNSWKYIYTLPTSKIYFYFSKLIILFWWLFISVLTAYILTMLLGSILSFLRPNIGFQNYNVNKLILIHFIKTFVVSLPILILQFVMSMIWSNFFRSMGIGLFLFIFCIVFMSWGKSYLLSYCYIFLILDSFRSFETKFFEMTIIFSLIYSASFLVGGYFLIKKMDVKN